MEKNLLNLDQKTFSNVLHQIGLKVPALFFKVWNTKQFITSKLNQTWSETRFTNGNLFFQFLHNWNNSDRQPIQPAWRTFRALAVSRIWSRKKGEDHLEDTRSSGVFSSLIPSSFIKELYPLATGLLFFCCWLLVHNVFHKLKERYFGKHVLIMVK